MSIPVDLSWRYKVPPLPVRRFTVAEYHQLARLGFFSSDERYELLDGWITQQPMVRNPPHDSFLDQIEEVISEHLPDGWRVRGQKAITLSTSEPEPDIAVVVGEARRYRASHPVPADVALVVEVADSSLSDDRNLKGPIYARDSLPAYWIVNIIDMRIEVYTDPTGPDPQPHYRQCRHVQVGDQVELILGGQTAATIPVAELLA